MAKLVPVDVWHHTSVVVNDYKSVVENFARFFGISRWEVRHLDAAKLVGATYQGEPVEHGFVSVLGSNGQLGIELVQPTMGPSSYQALLDSAGEGMHGTFATVCEPSEFEALRPTLEAEGIGILQSGPVGEGADYYFLDTREKLANIVIEVVCPKTDNWMELVAAPDEVLEYDLGSLGPSFIPTGAMLHIGVVCKDRDAVKAAMQRLLGIERWIEFHIESGVTIDNCTFYGESVFHEYDNHVGRRNGLCYELITPKTDKNVYHEFYEQRGEGMHHTFPCLIGAEEWKAAQPALEAADMPVIQGGSIGDLMEYYYVDTRRYLPGITTEVVIPGREDWLELMFENAEDAKILTG